MWKDVGKMVEWRERTRKEKSSRINRTRAYSFGICSVVHPSCAKLGSQHKSL